MMEGNQAAATQDEEVEQEVEKEVKEERMKESLHDSSKIIPQLFSTPESSLEMRVLTVDSEEKEGGSTAAGKGGGRMEEMAGMGGGVNSNNSDPHYLDSLKEKHIVSVAVSPKALNRHFTSMPNLIPNRKQSSNSPLLPGPAALGVGGGDPANNNNSNTETVTVPSCLQDSVKQEQQDQMMESEDPGCLPQEEEDKDSFEIEIRCGVSAIQGRRKSMEDSHEMIKSLKLVTATSPTIDKPSPLHSNSSNIAQHPSSDSNSGLSSPSSSQLDEDPHPTQPASQPPQSSSQPTASQPNLSDLNYLNLDCGFFGVYDGHGGKKASDFTSKNLHKLILDCQKKHHETEPQNAPNSNRGLVQAIIEGFRETEEQFLKIAKSENLGDGTTAIVLFVLPKKIVVGCVGDSECVLSRAGKAINLTEPHNPQKNKNEAERIKREGGRLHGNRLAHPFLNPQYFNIAVSRSIGNLMFKHPEFTKGKPSGLSAEVEVKEENLCKDDQFVILACDGLWDVMNHQAAVDFVLKSLKEENDDPQKVCDKLVEHAYEIGSTDNITVMLVLFH